MKNISCADIEDRLPQTQCERCGYQGCTPYAQAILRHEAPINLCTPGGQVTVNALAELLGQAPLAIADPEGAEQPKQKAVIDPDRCIGCTLCLQACPVDAIVGAAKHMHAVLEEDCTGCRLCVEPCPTACIRMQDETPLMPTWRVEQPRMEPYALRAQKNTQRRRQRLRLDSSTEKTTLSAADKAHIQEDIAQALLRYRQKRQHDAS